MNWSSIVGADGIMGEVEEQRSHRRRALGVGQLHLLHDVRAQALAQEEQGRDHLLDLSAK